MDNKTKMIISAIVVILLAIILLIIFGLKSPEYIVSFDSDGGSFVPSQTIKKDELVTKPDNPKREGYDFLYWSLDDKEYDFTSKVEKDLTLKAKWGEQTVDKVLYDITFTLDGKTKKVSVSKSDEIDIDALGFEEKDGYEIKWYVNGEEYDLNTPLTGNTTIEGKYIKTSLYTVKFNSEGGSKVANQNVKDGDKVTEPDNVTKYGYILSGWFLNNSKYDFNTPVTKNLTLVAKWEEDPNVKRYTVTFDNEGKTTTQKVIENQTAMQPTNPTKSGFAFDGWYLDNTKYSFSTKVKKDITLTAKFRKLNDYTVTFKNDDGTVISTSTVKENSKVTRPADPTKTDYKFKDWQLNGKTYKFTEAVTKDITLIASWTKLDVVYTITATRADNYSPDSILKVFKNSTEISVKEIKYSDGVHLCDGSKLVVNTNDISGEKEFIVVLADNTEVKAKLK